MLDEQIVESLRVDCTKLLKRIHYVEDPFGLDFNEHCLGTCINYNDILEVRDQFVEELTLRMVDYVYSRVKQAQIKQAFIEEDRRTEGDAHALLRKRARNKFRTSNLQGQFSELLVFNLLQAFFQAIPMVRKMPLTTNPNLERNGADGIHVKVVGETPHIYIAECKTSDRATGAFRYSLKESVEDVIHHYNQHLSELDLYTFEDFLPEEIENFARAYLRGDVEHVQVNLVCMATYGRSGSAEGLTKEEILHNTLEEIKTEISCIELETIQNLVPDKLKPRLHVIFFPVYELTELLQRFESNFA